MATRRTAAKTKTKSKAKPKTKTKPTAVSVASHLAATTNAEQRKDCKTIAAMLTRVTGAKPKMWGPSIVGFGSYHYKYASGHEGDTCLAGFAARGGEIVLYLTGTAYQDKPLLASLGPHRIGKGCLYIKRLADLDVQVLERLVRDSVTELKATYG